MSTLQVLASSRQYPCLPAGGERSWEFFQSGLVQLHSTGASWVLGSPQRLCPARLEVSTELPPPSLSASSPFMLNVSLILTHPPRGPGPPMGEGSYQGELWDPKIRAESCSGLSCRWLAQNGEWVYPIFTGPLFVLTFCSLLSLHLSDPGILHQGSNELGPMMAPVVWVNHRAFLLQWWCPKCCFLRPLLRPLRTYHITWCNICVEEFDHHCKWVNNCIGHSNFRVFMLLVQSLCLYSDAMLVTCLIFLVRTIHLPFTTGKIIVYQSGCGAPLGRARGRHPSGHTRRRLPAASLRAAANQGQVGERGPALPRGQGKAGPRRWAVCPVQRGGTPCSNTRHKILSSRLDFSILNTMEGNHFLFLFHVPHPPSLYFGTSIQTTCRKLSTESKHHRS
nr:uncharacterized protein LOC123281826 [Equus asinus]